MSNATIEIIDFGGDNQRELSLRSKRFRASSSRKVGTRAKKQKNKKKQGMTGKGEGKEGFLFSPPRSTSFFAPALTTLANCYTGSRGTGNKWG